MNIKTLREKKGISQKELAAALNVGQSTVSTWETGEGTPTHKNLIKLAAVLGCTINDIVAIERK